MRRDTDKISIRPLERGAEMLWLGVAPTDGDPAEQLKELTEELAREDDRDPRSRLLAFKAETAVGRLEGVFLNPTLYFIRKILATDDAATERIGDAFAAYLAPEFRRDGISILVWDKPEAEMINRCLRRSGFVVDKEKAFVKKDVSGYRAPEEDPLEYETLSDLGEDRFIELLSEAAAGDPFEDVSKRDPRHDFRELVEYAGSAFDATCWRVASLEGRPVGVVLPQEFADSEHEGTLFYVGVLPEFRGRGFGTILHASGLAFLAEHGVTKYIGSTDTRNHPMMRVFERNGCTRTGTQLFYKALRKTEGDDP
jgi:RimJ/RimL family protein N-acetyltransferase